MSGFDVDHLPEQTHARNALIEASRSHSMAVQNVAHTAIGHTSQDTGTSAWAALMPLIHPNREEQHSGVARRETTEERAAGQTHSGG